jgi:hypothetical protein
MRRGERGAPAAGVAATAAAVCLFFDFLVEKNIIIQNKKITEISSTCLSLLQIPLLHSFVYLRRADGASACDSRRRRGRKNPKSLSTFFLPSRRCRCSCRPFWLSAKFFLFSLPFTQLNHLSCLILPLTPPPLSDAAEPIVKLKKDSRRAGAFRKGDVL